MKKQVISLLTGCIMTAALLAGCGKDAGKLPETEGQTEGGQTEGGQTKGGQTEENQTAAAAEGGDTTAQPEGGGEAQKSEQLGAFENPLKVVMVNQTSDDMSKQYEAVGETVDNNRWTKLYKDRLNIDIDYMWVAKADAYSEKFNVMMASGELPDIMKVTPTQFKQLLDADQLADLTDGYNTYMNDDYKEAAGNDPYMLKSSTFDGKIMGIPGEPTKPYSGTQQLWIRSDWMEKLNLDEPENMEDVYQIAREFMKARPDGVDTYGIALDKDSFICTNSGVPGFPGLANSYHSYPNIWIKGADGKLTNGSIAPETKEVLSVMQGLFQEGIIDGEFAVKDGTAYNEDLIAGKVGITYNWLGIGLAINDLKSLKPDAEFKAYPLVSADGETARPQTRANVESWYVVRKGFSNPEAMIKMANLHIATLMTSETDELSPDGKTPNSEYYGAPPEAPSAFNFVDFWFSLTPDQNANRFYIYDAVKKQDSSAVSANDMPIYTNLLAYENGDLTQWGWNRTFGGPNGGAETTQIYMADDRAYIDQYLGLPTETMAERQATLEQLQAETFTKIVMGAESIDGFDMFVEKWLSLGGKDMTAEVNEWYEANQ